jgi:colicin import membrane protein
LAKKLKTYVTSLGFYDQAVAAPSMKAALDAWGSKSNLFHQGFAKEADDPAIVKAAMAKPGVVLKRPIGSDEPFSESAELPTSLFDGAAARPAKSPRKQRKPDKKIPDTTISKASARKAALAFEREQKKRENERAKEEAARARARERREAAIATAQEAFDKAEREHLKRAGLIEDQQAELEARAQAERARWEAQKKKLQDALRRARSAG